MTHSASEFKIGLVGCGRISQSYVQAVSLCPNLRITAVMDVRRESAEAAGEAADCETYWDLEDFAAKSGLDGAIVCSPPNTHRPVSCALMRQGIHVLCEKPFATNWADALAMVNVSSEMDRTLMMASKFRHVEDIIQAKSIIASGMLGEIQYYENRFLGKVNMKDRWNSDPEISGGGVVMDNGTHSVDIARYLLGRIEKVQMPDARSISGLKVEDTATLNFLSESGAMGTIFLSWSVPPDDGGFIQLYGSEGVLSIGWEASKYRYNGQRKWVTFGVGYNKVAAFKSQTLNFVQTVQGTAPPVIAVEDSLASVRVIEAAYSSRESGHWRGVEAEYSTPARNGNC